MTLRSSLGTALALFIAASAAVAQEPVSPLLNDLELRQMVARGEPADHARLSIHFTALAAKYAADAKRHASMEAGATALSSKQPALAVHCRQLVTLNTQLQTTALELAAYHDKAAHGTPAARPADPAGLATGVGARKPSDEELSAFATKAESGDHRAQADYFSAMARRYTAEVDAHTAMASAYRGTRLAPVAEHCDRLVKLAKAAAREARAASELHVSRSSTVR